MAYHRSACATSGFLASRALPLEHAVAHVCREAGAQVARNVRVGDMNIDVPVSIEVVANGLPLWHGAQLAIDATIVSPVTRTGSVRPGADTRPAAAVQDAARRKRRQIYGAPDVRGSSYSGSRLAGASALKLPPSCAPWHNTVPPAWWHRCDRLRVLAGCRGGPGCSLLLRCEPTRLPCKSFRLLVRPASRVKRRNSTKSLRMCRAGSPPDDQPLAGASLTR